MSAAEVPVDRTRHMPSDPGTLWTTTNIGEALPGVITPLGWGIWWRAMDGGLRRTFAAFGVLPESEAGEPARDEDRIISVFFGRAAVRAEFILNMADRLPGTSGEKAAQALFSVVPEGFVSRPQPRYYARAAMRVPAATLRSPRMMRQARAETDRWWRMEVARVPRVPLDEACRVLAEADERFSANSFLHMLVTFTTVQPSYEQLGALVEKTGVGSTLLTGAGDHEETRFVHDLWACSRDELDLATFIERHGYHGPDEGEISGRVWREDPRPVERMIEGYRQLGDDADPRTREQALRRAREEDERRLLAAVPRFQRPLVRALIAFSDRHIPLRGVGKVAFLQSLDVARVAARRIGVLLAADGVLDDPLDVFFLTAEEIRDRDWADARERVAARRRCHEHWSELELPVSWHGTPEPRRIDRPTDAAEVLEGVGASAGVVEGRARLVLDPADAEIESGDILVARATDPSWAAIMFISAGLVMDMGGTLSHAAVVARELGIPCVADTRVGTRVINDGDRLRVDGSTGRVEVLERAIDPATTSV